MAVAVSILTLPLLVCSTPAAPKSCIEVAEEKGVHRNVIALMKKPHEDLQKWQRFAIRVSLDDAGIGKVCDKYREEQIG